MRLLCGVTFEQTLVTSVAGNKNTIFVSRSGHVERPRTTCWKYCTQPCAHVYLLTHADERGWSIVKMVSWYAPKMRDKLRRHRQLIKRWHMQNSPDLATRKKMAPSTVSPGDAILSTTLRPQDVAQACVLFAKIKSSHQACLSAHRVVLSRCWTLSVVAVAARAAVDCFNKKKRKQLPPLSRTRRCVWQPRLLRQTQHAMFETPRP